MKTKKIKAWAIVTDRGKIIGSNMEFSPGNAHGPTTRYPAIYMLKVFAERRKSWIVGGENYNIVPIEITYSLPTPKNQKK